MLSDNQILHRQYLQSHVWKEKRNQALSYYGSICSSCGGHGSDVHHLTYERSGGNEKMEDLQVLCRECHETKHVIEKASKSNPKRKKVPIRAISAYRYLTKNQINSLVSLFGLRDETDLFISCQRDNRIIGRMSEVLGIPIVKSKQMPELKPDKKKKPIRVHWSALSD